MCDCSVCKTIDKLRWATITECKCICHKIENVSGHEYLCCAYPNGKVKDNPYKDGELADKESYQLILNQLEIY